MEIRKTIEIDASAETVFQALTAEDELIQWFPDVAVLEPKIGGKVRFTFYAKKAENLDRDFYPNGEIIEFVPNKTLSYTWIPQDIPDFPKTVVSWTLHKINKNKTKVELVHSGFVGKPQELFKEHHTGWDYFTGRLVNYCQKLSSG
ncbi:MAG: SRPBCC family protein [Nitrosopumilus sp.]